ncbi:MAG: hypothetical protein MZU91_07770 [Desulfosudis oleivorans]|nr:hypothetical protein [Desulfosudis oleivorans]
MGGGRGMGMGPGGGMGPGSGRGTGMGPGRGPEAAPTTSNDRPSFRALWHFPCGRRLSRPRRSRHESLTKQQNVLAAQRDAPGVVPPLNTKRGERLGRSPFFSAPAPSFRKLTDFRLPSTPPCLWWTLPHFTAPVASANRILTRA